MFIGSQDLKMVGCKKEYRSSTVKGPIECVSKYLIDNFVG